MRPHQAKMAAAGRRRGGAPLDAYAGQLVRAFSTRRLLSDHLGYLFQIQRSADSTTLDCNSVADAQTFVGAGNGTVTRWYDQGGSGTYVANLGTPRLIDAGVTNTIAGGAHPAIYINAANEGFDGLPSVLSQSRSVFARLSITPGAAGVLLSRSIAQGYAGVYQNGSTGVVAEQATGAQYLNGVAATRDQAHDGLVFTDAVMAVAFTADSQALWATPRVFGYPVTVTSLAYLVDWVMFDSALGAGDVAAISGALVA